MSLIIKGLDMPKEAGKMLHIDINQYGEIWRDDEYIGELAIQIPKGHGRLIDVKDVFGTLVEHGQHDHKRFKLGETIRYELNEIQPILETDAPTILEAEDG